MDKREANGLDGDDAEVKQWKKSDEDDDGGERVKATVKEEEKSWREGREKPPVDDCCPICFGSYTIPCRTNCGHWFCGSCILQLWNYRGGFRQCKCPMCSCLINNLAPEKSVSSQQDGEVSKVLRSVQSYNDLYAGGRHGLYLKLVLASLLLRRTVRRVLHELMDPQDLRLNYYVLRLLACLLAYLYYLCGGKFIPGPVSVFRLFDVLAIILVGIFALIGICRKWVLRWQARRLAALQV